MRCHSLRFYAGHFGEKRNGRENDQWQAEHIEKAWNQKFSIAYVIFGYSWQVDDQIDQSTFSIFSLHYI